MKKNRILFFIFLFLFNAYLYAKEKESAFSAYNGSSGLLEIPNARIMPDWHMRFFLNFDKPYNYYGATITPLPFMELNFHMTQLDSITAMPGSGYGQYKDKAINIKLLLRKEEKGWPAVVLGADDIWGTSLYTSKYIVISKKYKYFDFTFGYAKGRLGGEDLRKYSTNYQNSGSFNNNAVNFFKHSGWSGGKFFGGVKLDFTTKLSAMVEYSPINYTLDKKNPFYKGSKYPTPTSHINFGFKYRLTKNTLIMASYQRGNHLSIGFSTQFGLVGEGGLFTHLPDPKWRASLKKKQEYLTYDEKTLCNKLSNEVAAERFSNVQTSINDDAIWCEIDNARYNLDIQAMGRALDTINEVAPKKYQTFYMTLKHRNVAYKTMRVNRAEFNAYINNRVSKNYMRSAMVLNRKVDKQYKEFSKGKKNIYKTDIYGTKRFVYYFAPKLKTFLNAKEDPFAIKFSLLFGFNYDVSDGVFLKAQFLHPFYNEIKKISSKQLEDNKLAIRSQMLDYYKYDHTQMKKLTFDFIKKAPNYGFLKNSFYKFEIGYFDYAFAGIDTEWFKPMWDDRFGIGLQYQRVYKRYVNDFFKVYDNYAYDAKFVNLYLLLSKRYDLHMTTKIGQFLAGDRGVRVDVVRNYKQFSLGGYFTVTNSNSVFSNSQNKGYIDKGVYLKVPLDVFTYKNVKGRVNYSISPWTRDVGQFASPSYSLAPMLNSENNIRIMKKEILYLQK